MPTQKTAESEPAGSALVTEMRATALDIFMHTLAESSIERMFTKSVSYEGSVLRVGDESIRHQFVRTSFCGGNRQGFAHHGTGAE